MVDYANMTNVVSISKLGIGPRCSESIELGKKDPLNLEQADSTLV